MAKWSTIRVRQETYDALKNLADVSGESLGDVCDVFLGGGVKELEQTVVALEKLSGAGGGLVTQSQGAEKATHKSSKPAQVRDEATQACDKATHPAEFTLVDVTPTETGDADTYSCGACQAPLDSKKPVCPECGKALNWTGAASGGGGGAILLGAAVLALAAIARQRAVLRPYY